MEFDVNVINIYKEQLEVFAEKANLGTITEAEQNNARFLATQLTEIHVLHH